MRGGLRILQFFSRGGSSIISTVLKKDIDQFLTHLLDVYVQGGSNMTGTDLYVNKPHCAAAVRP